MTNLSHKTTPKLAKVGDHPNSFPNIPIFYTDISTISVTFCNLGLLLQLYGLYGFFAHGCSHFSDPGGRLVQVVMGGLSHWVASLRGRLNLAGLRRPDTRITRNLYSFGKIHFCLNPRLGVASIIPLQCIASIISQRLNLSSSVSRCPDARITPFSWRNSLLI